MALIQPVINEKSADLIQMYYRSAMKKVIGEINSSSDFSRSRRLSVLKQTEEILGELGDKSKAWADKQIKESYMEGGKTSVRLLNSVNEDVKYSFSLVDQDAVRAMADETFQDFGHAIQMTNKSVQRLMTNAEKSQINAILADGRITGDARLSISDRIAGMIKDGFLGMQDAGGRTWDIEVYARMLARTKMLDATNTGLTNQLSQRGYDLVKVSTHGGSCPICEPYDGAILSISGDSEDYDSVEDAKSEGFPHPNCKHRFYPYSDDFSKSSDKWSAEEDLSDEIDLSED